MLALPSRMRSALVTVTLVASALVPKLASAQSTPCRVERPGDVPHCPPVHSPRPAPPPLASSAVDVPTHSMGLPTGNTLRAGQWQLQSYDVAVWNRFAVGLTDRVEASVGTVMLSTLTTGLKVALTPRDSAFRFTIGANMLHAHEDHFVEDASSVGATFAWQRGSLNLHTTLSVVAVGDGGDDDVGVLHTGGVLWRANDSISLSFERICMATARNSSEDCGANMMGAKLHGLRGIEIDLGLVVPDLGDDTDDGLVLPIIGFTMTH